jgi:hypothetical protein
MADALAPPGPAIATRARRDTPVEQRDEPGHEHGRSRQRKSGPIPGTRVSRRRRVGGGVSGVSCRPLASSPEGDGSAWRRTACADVCASLGASVGGAPAGSAAWRRGAWRRPLRRTRRRTRAPHHLGRGPSPVRRRSGRRWRAVRSLVSGSRSAQRGDGGTPRGRQSTPATKEGVRPAAPDLIGGDGSPAWPTARRRLDDPPASAAPSP